MVVSASFDSTIRIWDAQTGECIRILEGHADIVFSAAFNNEGSMVVLSSGDQSIRIWDVLTGVYIKVFEASSYKVSFKLC